MTIFQIYKIFRWRYHLFYAYFLFPQEDLNYCRFTLIPFVKSKLLNVREVKQSLNSNASLTIETDPQDK